MKVASLEAYGAHADLLAAWTQQYNEQLLPIQEKAVLEGNVLNGDSVVGSGPTGCGKTFIAEMAATHAATQGRRTFYLAPTKALAEAVHHRFSRTYAPLGLRVEVSTQDRRSADRRIARGDFDIAVTVPEKLWSMMLASPALLRSVGALVVDELQMVGDPERGPCLELLLAKFLQAGAVQIVGLSAVLSNGRELADWLGARLVEEHRRPVELRKGVWCAGRFAYYEHNSRAAGEEDMAPAEQEDASALHTIVALAAELAARGEPTLVFLRDRLSSVRAAQEAAVIGDCPPAERALEALRELPRTQATETLAELLQSSVAFHNADLHFSERRLVEEAFVSGEVLCLFCTTTLALGVNLPARNVIVEPLKWQAAPDGAPSLAPMPQADFENMAGRAGRLGFNDPFGRAILLGAAGFDSDSLMRRYINAGPEPVEGQLGRLPELQRFMLTAALNNGHGPQHAPPRLLSSPCRSALQRGPERVEGTATPSCGPDNLVGHAVCRSALQRSPERVERSATLPSDIAAIAESAGLITRSPLDGGLELTGLGRAAAASGLAIATLTAMTRAIDHLGRAPTNLEALILASLSEEARGIPLPRDREHRRWIPLLEERAQAASGWTDCARGILWSGPLRAAEREAAARIALLVLEWTGWDATADLETQTGVHVGRALALCDTVGWLVQCLARLAEELAIDPADVQRLQSFAETISAGVPEDCLPLRRMHVSSLQRDHILALAGAGLTTESEVLKASSDDLRPLLPSTVIEELRNPPAAHGAARRSALQSATRPSHNCERGFQPVLSTAEGPRPSAGDTARGSALQRSPEPAVSEAHRPEQRRRAEGNATPSSTCRSALQSATSARHPEHSEGSPPDRPNVTLVVDEGRPDLAIVHGNEVHLRPMEFQLLSVLAHQPRRCVSFDRLYDELWGSKEAVEPQQIYWHRHNLAKKLRQGMPPDAQDLVRTIPRRGLMLDLPPDQVAMA